MTTTPERTHGRLMAHSAMLETEDTTASPRARRRWPTTPHRWHVITSEHGRVVSVELESDWAMGQHQAVRAGLTGTLLQVLDHHAPHGASSGLLDCTGCDLGTHPEGRPYWPCSTWVLIAAGVEDTEESRQVLADARRVAQGPPV